MEPDISMALSSLGGCIGWLTAIVFLVVGLVPVRKAHATSGYLIAAGGLLRWGFFCCQSLPMALYNADQYELADTLGALPSLAAMMLWLLSSATIVAGFATLARHVTASTGMNQAMNVPGGVS